MNRVAFLFDEHMPPACMKALLALHPEAKTRLIGVSPDAPPKQTPDREVLIFCEVEQYALVTFDKDTMPGHVNDHLANNRHTWGVLLFPNGNNLSAGVIAAELSDVWELTNRDEWIDKLEYLPH